MIEAKQDKSNMTPIGDPAEILAEWPPLSYSPMTDMDWLKVLKVLTPAAFALGFLAGKVL